MEKPRGKKPTLPPTRKPKLPPGASGPKSPPGRKPKLPPGSPSGDSGPALSRKDFQTDQDVRWCPGCGDYAILAQLQRTLPEMGVPREKIVFISGIGCSSRFPYYMETYGMHSIHGRAPAIATGLKASRSDLDVWIVTGDGDGLSIGGNHLIHILRRNVNVQILLFNNQIYGLTKGQYSPTSEKGKITKSTPFGSVDYPFNPVELALGANSSFVARTMDRDPKHMGAMLKRAHKHGGAAFLEIYQNCNIFNDGAFFTFTEKATRPSQAIFLEHEKPMIFDEGRKGLRIDGYNLEVVDLESGAYST
ncbi:MAG: 2-oxoacid:ferredoxin oxidoreductase subunit beta, partial [Candidatus Latescibacterota bacterium]